MYELLYAHVITATSDHHALTKACQLGDTPP